MNLAVKDRSDRTQIGIKSIQLNQQLRGIQYTKMDQSDQSVRPDKNDKN